jgi:hypothetical protein
VREEGPRGGEPRAPRLFFLIVIIRALGHPCVCRRSFDLGGPGGRLRALFCGTGRHHGVRFRRARFLGEILGDGGLLRGGLLGGGLLGRERLPVSGRFRWDSLDLWTELGLRLGVAGTGFHFHRLSRGLVPELGLVSRQLFSCPGAAHLEDINVLGKNILRGPCFHRLFPGDGLHGVR